MNCTSRITAAFAAAAFIGATGALAADLTVPYGESTNITESVTFDTVIVNGDLTVAQGVTLTATKFFVSQNNSGRRATVLLQNNAKIKMPSWSVDDSNDQRCRLGDGSPATLTMNAGSSFTATHMRIATGISTSASDGQTPVQVVLNDATLELTGISGCASGGNIEFWSISLNGANALLNAANVNISDQLQSARIRFGGGLVKFDKSYKFATVGNIRLMGGNQSLALESINGNPLRFAFTGYDGGMGSVKSLFDMAWGGTIYTTGSGAFQMERPMTIHKPLVTFKPERTDQHLIFGHTGGFRVLGGAEMILDQFSSTAISSMSSGANNIVMEAGSLVDLNGANVTFDAVTCAGTITNTSETAATLTVGASGGDAVFGIAPSVPVVKAGAGALRIPDGALSSVSVQGGTLDLCDRASMGFPYYRFWVKAPKGNIRLSEFALYDGADNVTGLRSAVSEVTEGGWNGTDYNGPASNIMDNDFSTLWDNRSLGNTSNWRTNKVYFVVHYGNAPNFKHSFPSNPGENDKSGVRYANPAYIASASPMQPVTAYTFAFAEKTEVAPLEWYFQGAMKGNEWRDLDHVTGFNRSGSPNDWCGTNFVANCGISTVSIESLSVANNATWAIDTAQADINVGSLTAGRDVTLVVSGVTKPKSKVQLPISVGTLSGSIGSWRMTFAEHPGVERSVCIEDGRICATPEATIVSFR